MDKHTQEEIRSNVEKLYSMVFQMRQDLSVTSTASVLSVAFVKQASDAEKLAKHIKNLARG